MSALTDLSDIVNRLTGGNSGTPEQLYFWKDSRVAGAAAVAPVAGRMSSLWLYSGTPGAGVAPGAVAAPTRATAGALAQANPGGGRQKWLLSLMAALSQPGTLILYDRLLHISGLSGTNTGAQTVAGSLTRYTSGAGNQIWIEVYTQIGASSTTITASYTDQDGNTGQTTESTAIGNTGLREAQRIIPLNLAGGDNGVRAVASVTLAATTGTAGDFGVTVAHPLMSVSVDTLGAAQIRDAISGLPGIPELLTDACLALAFFPSTTTALQAFGGIVAVEK